MTQNISPFCCGDGIGTGTDDFTAGGSNRMNAKEHSLCVQIQLHPAKKGFQGEEVEHPQLADDSPD